MSSFSKKILVCLAIFVISGVALLGLFEARKHRVWPFNSGLSRMLPPFVKQLAYNITSPNRRTVSSFLYNIDIDYFIIPDAGATGGGGAVNILNNGKILITLNNGQSLVLDKESRVFQPVSSQSVMNKFSSVRDAILLEANGKTYIAIFGTFNVPNACKKIALYLAEYTEASFPGSIQIGNLDKLWESEEACDEPVDNNAGGRLVYEGGQFYLSTGWFMRGGVIGDTPIFPQVKSSSFGKTLKVSWNGLSEVVSMGHRNPQGLFYSNTRGILFATEHAMRGGDELNIIKLGGNYGWPCESYGTQYTYDLMKPLLQEKTISSDTLCQGRIFKRPQFYWSDSTGISQGLEYKGEEFPAFNGNLIIGSLAATSIYRISLGEQNNVEFVERINVQERIRDLTVTKRGEIVVLDDAGSILILSASR